MAIAPDKAISETSPTPATHQEFDWQNCWYPIAFTQDLPKDKPYRFSLYNEPLVLFRNQEGKLGCLTDRCSHRAARLSDGQIIDGRIECLYHGWQFGIDGQCLHIPQLPQDAKIPAKACVKSLPVVERQGIIWMWAGQEQPLEELIPIIPELDKPGVFCTDYIRDLPYDQTYFIENVIDPAHVYISHDGIVGKRENAQPLDLEVLDSSLSGIRGRWRSTRQQHQPWSLLNFVAPNLVIYQSSNSHIGKFGGVVLYSLPMCKDRCRILLRNYGNFFPWQVKLMPRWFDHIMIRNIILEGDLQIVVEQKRQIERLGKSLKEIYLPLKTSDTLVVEYRKWLDKFGQGLPFYQGYDSEKNFHSNELQESSLTLDRLSQHTQICSSCNQAYRVTNSSKQILIGVAIALAALAILTDNSWVKPVAVAASLFAVVLAFAAQQLKTKFERAYTRH
ncbi:Rieske 2Fe-2S domain-containing protein [Nostoc sp. FACHB-280]|uniref:aromatic ring-hydroxylating dioxygenase subunit alpha n=1 Tax=Nostoc sp. FACHB-280 TaxID=2692839 RepID=UPI00168B464B|nr:Rieske 2Fe-2S domain-containing protein [Nostoc sp. FACHB-280]MBD2497416.1 Rieske 2Fe-2S domain-containing protein [Nostoc sp. FACHB-280]